jgi:hypothetical protein
LAVVDGDGFIGDEVVLRGSGQQRVKRRSRRENSLPWSRCRWSGHR